MSVTTTMQQRPGGNVVGPLLTLGVMLGVLALLSVAHLSQGTASQITWEVMIASRAPRLLAGILVGVALGSAGTAMQGITRNTLASPDTLAVNAGANIALTIVAAFGIRTGAISGVGIAFIGGVAAALGVLALAGRGASTVRLILGGSVLALAGSAIASALILVRSQETQGLFAWGAGSLSQPGYATVSKLALPTLLAVAAMVCCSRWLDILQCGDDAARSLGLDVARSRLIIVLLAVFLAAAAVTLCGPIGFVGLCAPALARILGGKVQGLRKYCWQIPLAALIGAVLIIGSDVILRFLLGAQEAIEIPTGVITTLIGGIFLIVLSRGMRTGTAEDTPQAVASRRSWAAHHPRLMVAVIAVILMLSYGGSLLLGDGFLLLGDLAHWMQGTASSRIAWILDLRASRAATALLAGAALALAGALTQAVTRNPLADTGLLGVAGGAGVGALFLINRGALGTGLISVGALVGAVIAAGVVFGLSARDGWQPTRLILVGLGVQAVTGALVTYLVVTIEPWNKSRAITWLGGSTYGAHWSNAGVLLGVIIVATVLLLPLHADLDLVALDDVSPRILGVHVSRVRLAILVIAVFLTAGATASLGVVSFVGLVAPHAARMLVGSLHARQLPLATLLGGLLVLVADAVGRSAIAPMQLPVGLVCSLIGLPWFCWLLWRMRGNS